MIKKAIIIGLTLNAMVFSLTGCNELNETGLQVNETKQVETVSNVNETIKEVETVKEEFVITSVENGIIIGELVNGSGEGIYYNLNDKELEKYPAFYEVNVNDLLMIEWTKENYDNEEWLDMESVFYNKQGYEVTVK